MNPKEKATDLFNKYYGQCNYFGATWDKVENAKQCALIAVDTVLEMYDDGPYSYKIMEEPVAEYWMDVKQEIEKL